MIMVNTFLCSCLLVRSEASKKATPNSVSYGSRASPAFPPGEMESEEAPAGSPGRGSPEFRRLALSGGKARPQSSTAPFPRMPRLLAGQDDTRGGPPPAPRVEVRRCWEGRPFQVRRPTTPVLSDDYIGGPELLYFFILTKDYMARWITAALPEALLPLAVKYAFFATVGSLMMVYGLQEFLQAMDGHGGYPLIGILVVIPGWALLLVGVYGPLHEL